MQKKPIMKPFVRQLILIFLIIFTVSTVFAAFSRTLEKEEEIALTQLVQDVQNGKVKQMTITGNMVEVVYHDDTKATTLKEAEVALSQSLLNYGVTPQEISGVTITQKGEGNTLAWVTTVMLILFPILILVFFFFFMFRQAKNSMGQAFDFGKARARLFGADQTDKNRVSFKDVAGLREAKEEVQEVVDFLKNPKKYLQMGARIPRGVLLVGSPGTGKTLLARAVANEAGVPFFSASGSEFIEMFVGVGSSRVRDLFSTAKKAGRSIVFIDELDAIGRQRGSGYGGGHDEREQTLNQILVEMDGFERTDATIVIAATNRPDVLDPALLRPGRFDRRIMLDLPDVNDREAILTIHGEGKPLSADVNIREIAERTPGFSGADLANLMNEAAILAARRNKQQVSQAEMLEAIDKVLLGPERKSHILSIKEKKVTAYHEAGHALVASSLPNADPVRKVSIISRGMAGGYTLKLPSEDRYLRTKAEFLDELSMLMGGYCAEKIVFKDTSTGASNDLQKVASIARRLVCEYGMSEKLGPVAFRGKDSLVPWQASFESRDYSEKTAAEIDQEISRFVKHAQKQAEKILRQKSKTLEKIADVLIEKEVLEREEFEQLVGKKTTKTQ
ncbi:MAG: ATP-dependent zinc metalloprotease FtsH [bacterium]|nr:ATP-dependent zinc metalloprotease FtsH [bacterium]